MRRKRTASVCIGTTFAYLYLGIVLHFRGVGSCDGERPIRMVGRPIKCSPEQIRDAIVKGAIDDRKAHNEQMCPLIALRRKPGPKSIVVSWRGKCYARWQRAKLDEPRFN